MNGWIIGLLALVGCGTASSAATDAGTGSDAVWTPDTGPGGGGVACGTTTCGAGQVCVHACQAPSCADAGVATPCPAPFCFTPPTACGTSHMCSCVAGADPCNTNHTFSSLGVCGTWSAGAITCSACD